MGRKDHLGTPDEDSRRRVKELKKVTSTSYQGNPPVFTEGLDQIGLKARTTGEVRDTDFPVLFDIDDQTGQKLDSYDIDLSLQEAHFHRIIIADEDDDTNPITNIDINFINLSKNKEVQFTIEFIKDPALVTFPTVTFSPLLEGVPASFPAAQDRWYFLCSARTLPDNTTRFQLLNISSATGSYIAARMDADQIANLAVTNHLQFNEIIEDGGIVLQGQTPTFDQTSGIFELKEGRVYYLYGDATVEFNGNNDTAKIAWWDITNNVQLGQKGSSFPFTNATKISTKHSAQTIFKPATDVDVELRITDLSGTITTIFAADTQANIFELGGGGGGTPSSTPITFPILYPEETIGSIGGPTQDINISGNDGQFKELTLTGNVNLTFSGFPSATVLEEFWVLVNQDGVGGHSLTATGSTVKNAGTLNSLLDSAANSQTLFHFATGDAGATIHAELVDLVASGGGFSGNLSDLVIDVNKDWNEKSITNLAGLDLFTTVANSVTNASTVTFISNAAVSRGQIGRSDFFGTAQGLTLNITANDNFVFSVDTVEKVKFDDTNDTIFTAYALDMVGNHITNIDYLESNTPNRPGDGFVRMAAADEVKWRNPGNTDDIFLGVGNDTLANESFQVTVASGVQFTVSAFSISAEMNNIIETGLILPAAGAQTVGESGNAYNEMWAQYFRPEPAALTTKHGFTAIANDRLLISYDGAGSAAGLGIYEDGVQKFLFNALPPDVIEFFIGRDPFLSGEEYRIQMGENSSSSARIFFIEGGGNDLILDRQGVGTTRGVQLRAAGLSTFIATNVELKAFSPLNMNSQEINNVGQVKADTSGTSQFGEFQPSNGGFDYLVRDRVSWDTDPDTYIEFATAGISIISDDDVIIASGNNDNVVIASDNQMNIFVTDGAGLTLTIGGGFPKFTFQDNAFISQEEIVMSGQKIVNMADPTSSQDAATKFYVDSVAGGGVLGSGNASIVIVKAIDVFRVSSTVLLDDVEMKFDAEANKLYYIEVNGVFSAGTTGDLKCGASIPSGAKYAIVNAGVNNDWSAFTTVDGGQSLVFQGSGTTDFRANNFWVLVETGGSSGTVAISVAQNQSSSQLTTWRKGSTMRVFQEGTSLPGGITQDIVLGTPDLTEFWVEDTGKDWIGIDNGVNDLNIVLGTTEPAGFTNSYTIDSNDFPNGATGWSFDAFGVMGTWTIENTGASTSFEAKLFINGREFANQGFGTGAGGWVSAGGWTTIENVQSGDTISIKAWSTGGSVDLRLRQRGIYTFPKAITCTAQVNTLTTSPDDTNEFIGTLPDSVSATLDDGEIFEYYLTNDQVWESADGEPDFEPYNFGDVMIRMVAGETARVTERDRNTFTGSSVNRFKAPYWNYPFGRYRTTSK